MAIYVKGSELNIIKKGDNEVTAIYKGDNLIYNNSPAVDKTPKVTGFINNATNIIDSSTTWQSGNNMELHIYNISSYPSDYITFTLTGTNLNSAYMLATNTDNVEAIVYSVTTAGITIGIKITSNFVTGKSTSFVVKIISKNGIEVDYTIDVVLNATATDYTPHITGFINNAPTIVNSHSWLSEQDALLELHINSTAQVSNIYHEITLVGKYVDNAYMLATNVDTVEATLNGFNASGLRVAFKITQEFMNSRDTTFVIKLISNRGYESDFTVNAVVDE